MTAPLPQRASPLRSLAEIAIVAAYLIFVPQLLEAAFVQAGYPTTGLARIAATAVIFAGVVGVVVGLLAWRGERPRDIGLKAPANLPVAILVGLATAALIFFALEELKRMGLMSETRLGEMARELKGDMTLALARAGLSLLVVGFVEELLFRGFVLDRIAKALGAGPLALAVAVPAQAVLFGLAHAYQGVEGMVFTGAVGFVFGVVFLILGRNLWPVIVAHGAFDAGRAMHLYASQTAGT